MEKLKLTDPSGQKNTVGHLLFVAAFTAFELSMIAAGIAIMSGLVLRLTH